MSSHNLNSQKKRRSLGYILFYAYMLFVLLSLFTVASYTWFSLSRAPRVSNMNVYITSAAGLELSWGSEEEGATPDTWTWSQELKFEDFLKTLAPPGTPEGEKITIPLRPVTWSDAQQTLIAAAYGFDGRLKDYDSWHPLTDDRNANIINKASADGYYIKMTYYARTGQNVTVMLKDAEVDESGENIYGTYTLGVPVWNPGHYETFVDEEGNEYEELVDLGHDNGGQGAENAIRFGFRITKIRDLGEEIADPQPMPFRIYEPNWNPDVETPSMDGTPLLIDESRLIRQTASFWEDTEPIERGVLIHTPGVLEEECDLFDLRIGEVMQIDMYIWLEGQDMDCTNRSSEAEITANIQFTGEGETQSGMVKIE